MRRIAADEVVFGRSVRACGVSMSRHRASAGSRAVESRGRWPAPRTTRASRSLHFTPMSTTEDRAFAVPIDLAGNAAVVASAAPVVLRILGPIGGSSDLKATLIPCRVTVVATRRWWWYPRRSRGPLGVDASAVDQRQGAERHEGS
jgi:hypothetical protein